MTNTPDNFMPSRPMLSRVRRSVLSLTVLASLFAGAAHAQVFVTDHTSIVANKAGFVAQLAKTVEEYKTQLDQYAQIMTSVQGLATGGISLMPSTLKPIRDWTSLVQQSCPGAGGGLMGDLTSLVTTTFSQSIVTSQQTICAQIIITQVNKYNMTVKVINDMQQFGSALQSLTTQISKVTTQGDSSRISANATTQAQQISTDMADWQSQMVADDAFISTLQQQQSILAKVAMKGSNTPLGNVIQAATFVAAFN